MRAERHAVGSEDQSGITRNLAANYPHTLPVFLQKIGGKATPAY